MGIMVWVYLMFLRFCTWTGAIWHCMGQVYLLILVGDLRWADASPLSGPWAIVRWGRWIITPYYCSGHVSGKSPLSTAGSDRYWITFGVKPYCAATRVIRGFLFTCVAPTYHCLSSQIPVVCWLGWTEARLSRGVFLGVVVVLLKSDIIFAWWSRADCFWWSRSDCFWWSSVDCYVSDGQALFVMCLMVKVMTVIKLVTDHQNITIIDGDA